MIKSDENKIEIYSVVDKKGIKQASVLLLVVFVMSVCFLIEEFNIVTIFMTIISLITLIISVSIYRNISEEPKLEIVLTKEKLEIYQKKDKVSYDMSRISSFSYDALRYNSLNEVFFSYYTEDNKKISKYFILRGMKNYDFCNLANELLKESQNKKTIQTLNEKIVNEEKTFCNQKIDTEISKILYYIGMKKNMNNFGTSYDLYELGSLLYFIDKNGNEYKLYKKFIKCEENVELKVNNFYEVKMDKDKSFYNINSTNFKFDSNIIEQYKNKIDIRNMLIFDDEIIKREISVLEKYIYFKQIYRNLIKLFFIAILIMGLIEKTLLKSIFLTIIPISIIIICLIFFIIQIIMRYKIKKIETY